MTVSCVLLWTTFATTALLTRQAAYLFNYLVKEDQQEAISSCWWPTTMILQVTEIFRSIQISFVHVNYYVEFYFHCLFFRSVFHVIYMVYSHWAVPGPRQEQWPGPEQWMIYVLTPVLVQVQCESFQTVSCNPFVPNSCPGLGSGSVNAPLYLDIYFDNRVSCLYMKYNF